MNNAGVNFDLSTIETGVFRYKYKGIPCWKCPFDFALYQMIIFDQKPDLIIEIGTKFGGSALYLFDLMNLAGVKGQVHTIDINTVAADNLARAKSIRYFSTGWDGYDISLTDGFKRVMVVDDGSHHYNDVKGAMNKFAGIVTPGQYYIVEDGVINHLNYEGFDGGPLRAIDELLNEREDFKIDRKLCNFFGQNATFNINGYLRKK